MVWHIIGIEVLTAMIMKSSIFRDISLCLPPDFTLVSCLAYFSTLKLEATCSSETSVDFQRTKGRYIPEDTILRVADSSKLLFFTFTIFRDS
jgi:hypothetical protein